ncbi:MAG: hypothetical protein SXA11_06825 [Cyanobacteriota bacterium]|nr:hypothetical protein [Cyanobacteriota bacterium]
MDKTKFKWPIWFPYPSSWLRVLSIIPFFPIGVYSSILLPMALLIFITNPPSEGKLFSFITILLVISVLLVCAFIYALGHHKLSRRAKGWIPSLLSDWKGFYAMIVLNFSAAPLWVFYFIFGKRVNYYSYEGVFRRLELPESVAQIVLILFFLIGASMFQIELLAYERWKKRRQKKLEKKRRQEEIDNELSLMKAETDKKRKEKLAKCKKTTWVSRNKKHKK